MKIYQVDAFTRELFRGNPAAVCPLEKWLPDETLQNIALENNLSETAFFVKQGNEFDLRWFTPEVEVNLCGHATLATGHVLFNHEDYKEETIIFNSKSGKLTVKKEEDTLVLDFPKDKIFEAPAPLELTRAFSITPLQVFRGRDDYMLVFHSESDIENLKPDFEMLSKVKCRGIIATARGEKADFVSRFFAPAAGIKEDPVTGSAHTTLAPYWANILGKTELSAIQLSKRKGWLNCKIKGDRVEIAGKAVTYMIGEIYI